MTTEYSGYDIAENEMIEKIQYLLDNFGIDRKDLLSIIDDRVDF